MPKSKNKGSISTAQLLGSASAIKDNTPRATSLCVVCNKAIPAARIEALKSLNLSVTKWAHTQCSTVTKVKGLYLGEVGTSQLQICNKIYDDSVRSVFRGADSQADDDE